MKQTRNLRKPLLAIGLCAALAFGFLAACGNPASPNGERETTLTPPAEDTGIVLNLYQPHRNQAGLWEALAADYKNLTGVTVNVRAPAAGSAAATELKEALEAEENAPGLFLFTNPREYKAWQESAADLSATNAYQQLADKRMALVVEEKVVGLPLGVEAFGIICNTKILDAYFALEDRDTDFDSIDDVNSHRELEALVKDLEANKAALGIDGVFAAPAFREGESTAWGTRLLSVPVGYEIKHRNIDITGDDANELSLRYEAGFRGFHELHLGHVTTREGLENRAYADAAREFATGRAAMILGSTDFLGQLNSVVGQTVSGNDAAFLPVFMNIEDFGHQGLAFETVQYAAVNGHANEEHRAAAEAFLDWLVTSEKGMDFLVNKLNVIAPYDSVIAGMPPSNPLALSALAWLQNSDVTNAITFSVLTPGEEFRDRVVGEGLLAWHRGESEWAELREDLREGWERHRARMDDHS